MRPAFDFFGTEKMKLTELKGISDKRAKDLNKLNIFTAEDMARFIRAHISI